MEADRVMLVQPASMEVKKALFSIKGDKATGQMATMQSSIRTTGQR